MYFLFSLNIFEVKDDIFDLPSKFSLAHCVCEDFHTSMGMTAEFKYDKHTYIFKFYFWLMN